MTSFSVTPTLPKPAPRPCSACGQDVAPCWIGVSWLEPHVCEACAQREQAARQARELLAAWLPLAREQFGERRFDLDPVALVPELERFARRGGDRQQCALYIHGPVGTGKTQQLAWMARRVLEVRAARGERYAGCPVAYVPVHRLLRELRADAEAIAAYERAPWLMLDEIGADELTPWGLAHLGDLVEYRISRNMPTVFSSNVSLGALLMGAVLGWDERIVTRMIEMCGQDEAGRPVGVLELVEQRRLKGGAR